MGAERQLQYLIGFKAIIQIIQNLIILNVYLINEERLITWRYISYAYYNL